MSELGNFLEQQLRDQRQTAGEMAASMGIDRSLISGFKKEKRRSCNIETLMKMVHGISDDPHVRAGFLEAYFRDQCIDPYKPWISVDPDQAAPRIMREDEPEYGEKDAITELAALLRDLRLANELVRSLADIARYLPGRRKFGVLIEDLAKFAKEELDKAGDTDKPKK